MTPARHLDVLLIGGGVASAAAAAELRDRGFEGSILLASRELDPPYHRPPITKRYLLGAESREEALVHPDGFYERQQIELCTRTSVTSLDGEARIAKLQGLGEIQYGQALIATGAMVRRLSIDGAQLGGIHYLRAPGNADALRRDAADAEHAVIIGGSYIGTEIAASLTELGVRCTILMLEKTTLEPHFGARAGGAVHALLERHGVTVLPGQTATAFEGDERVKAVLTESGNRLEADLVVVGIGATPDTMLAKKSGLAIGDTGGVRCDRHLQTSLPGVFAAGDVCEYDSILHREPVRIEHEHVAIAQGRTAARNMLGDGVDHDDVPYFWSDLSDWATLEYVGLGGTWDDEHFDGSTDDDAFAVEYRRAGRLVGVLAINRPDVLDEARARIRTDACDLDALT